MQCICSLEAHQKNSQNLYRKFADLHMSCRSSGTIFGDPQGDKALRSLHILLARVLVLAILYENSATSLNRGTTTRIPVNPETRSLA